MRLSNTVSHALTVSVAVSMLAGCSSGSDNSQLAPTTLGSFPGGAHAYRGQGMRDRINSILAVHRVTFASRPLTAASFMSARAVHKPLIFVADGVSNVDIYPQAGTNQNMIGQITGLNGAFDVATDTARNLYVTSNGNNGEVLVYARPYTKAPILTIDDGGTLPNGVAVSRRGVVAVANLCGPPSCARGSGNVTFYAKDSTEPCATVTDPTTFAIMYFDAFDDKGNLYIDGFNSGGSTVIGKIPGGCRANKITPLTTSNTVDGGGIKVDKADGIAIYDASSVPSVIDTYRPPKRGSLGSPASITPLTSSSTGCELAFAFLASGINLYTADFCSGVANEYNYPTGGAAENTITVTSGIPLGVAVTPVLVP